MGLGRLLGALNPLDAHAAAEMGTTLAERGWRRALEPVAGLARRRGVLGSLGSYFRGESATLENGALRFFKPAADDMARAASIRRTAAVGVGAWAGLNLAAPDHPGTRFVNTAAMAAGYFAAMPGVSSLASRYAGGGYAKTAYQWGGGALLANRILGIA